MGSKHGLFVLCLLGALVAVACGNDDDGGPGNNAGNAGVSGKGNAGNSGKAGGSNGGGAGTDPGGDAGEGGAGGSAPACTQFSALVHDIIAKDTNEKSAPRPVNDIVFCDDPADPAAFSDLF
jgi:hypothetical protein